MSDVQSIPVASSMLFKPSATPEYQKNPARWIYERLVEAVENFEKDLPNNMQAGGILTSFNGQIFSIDALQEARRVDGIVETVYTQDCFPKTLQQRGVRKKCFERANLGQKIFCSKSEIKTIEEYYKKGQDSDLLNNGSSQFCAD